MARGILPDAFDAWGLRVLLQFARGLFLDRQAHMEPFVWLFNATFGRSLTVHEVFGLSPDMPVIKDVQAEVERRARLRRERTLALAEAFPGRVNLA